MVYIILGMSFVLFPVVSGAILLIGDIVDAVKHHRQKEEAEGRKHIESYIRYRIRQDRKERKVA